MALTLLFSRNRTTDESVRFTDVPIETASIVVDAVSFVSKFRRAAGWLYPIRQASTLDFERGEGRLILFGKSRVVFNDFPAPYFLEFFPRYGVSKFILSFYSGEYAPPEGDPFTNVPPGGWFVDFNPATGRIMSRFGPPGSEVYELASGAIDAFIFESSVWSRYPSGYCWSWNTYTSTGLEKTIAEYEAARSSPGAVVLS